MDLAKAENINKLAYEGSPRGLAITGPDLPHKLKGALQRIDRRLRNRNLHVNVMSHATHSMVTDNFDKYHDEKLKAAQVGVTPQRSRGPGNLLNFGSVGEFKPKIFYNMAASATKIT